MERVVRCKSAHNCVLRGEHHGDEILTLINICGYVDSYQLERIIVYLPLINGVVPMEQYPQAERLIDEVYT